MSERVPPTPIEIGSSTIGQSEPVWVIAEAGVNHNGDISLAEQLVIEAKRAGADCVKFQTFSAARVATAASPKAEYQLRSTDPRESQIEMLRKLEIAGEAYERLVAACAHEQITFLSTPYSSEDVDLLESLGVDAFKIASALLVEPQLLRRVAVTGKPILLSTGLATLEEVEQAVDVIRTAGNEQLVLLQCTTDYPARSDEANLRAMRTMSDAFGVLTGYSDHTETMTTAIAAVTLGAVVVEKHLTLDKSLPGPDQATSAEPAEFQRYVDAIREAQAALGDGRKEPSESERLNLVGMRRSLVATRTIPEGTRIDASMLGTKRPATGIAPRDLERVVGQVASTTIAEDQPVEWWMLA